MSFIGTQVPCQFAAEVANALILIYFNYAAVILYYLFCAGFH